MPGVGEPPPEDDLPPLPGEWVWNTRTPNVVVAYDRASGAAVQAHEVGADGRASPRRAWRVVGPAGFDDRLPVFSPLLAVEGALDRLVAAVDAVEADGPAAPDRVGTLAGAHSTASAPPAGGGGESGGALSVGETDAGGGAPPGGGSGAGAAGQTPDGGRGGGATPDGDRGGGATPDGDRGGATGGQTSLEDFGN